MSPNSNIWLAIILSSLLLLLELFIVFKLYLRLLKLVFRQSTWIDMPVPLWITTIAIAAVCFPATFSGFLIRPVQFITSELYRHSVAIKMVLIPKEAESKLPDASSLFDGLFMSLQQFIGSYNALYMILFVALCILISFILRKNFNDGKGTYSTAHLADSYKKVAILIFFIICSLYIIFTSLVGLTYIQKNKLAPNVNIADVDSMFRSKTEIDETVMAYDSSQIAKKIASLEACLQNIKSLDTLSNSLGKDTIQFLARQVEANITTYKGFSNIVLDDWRKLIGRKKRLENDLVNKKEVLKSKFVVYKGSLSNYLLQTYAGQLNTWYNTVINNSIEYYKTLKSEFELVQNSVVFFGDDLVQVYNNNYELFKRGQYDAYFISKKIDPTTVYFEINKYDADLKKNDLDIYAYIPDPPTSGNEWGVIGKSSQWLMSPNSVDLVLIIGMFGFGLFGAAISTFIRDNQKNINAADPVAEHIAKVLIKGVSAAIVVFLGTKGGIALINNGTNDPNAYILFFTCLVGAVFSDEIWDWAKSKIDFNQSQGNDRNTNVTNTTEARPVEETPPANP